MNTATVEKPKFNPIFAEIAKSVEQMSSNEVISEILTFNGPIRLDFTEDFLTTLSLEKLQHILMTAKLYKIGKQSGVMSQAQTA